MQDTGAARFGRLLSPGRIGSLELRNRIALCPMGVLFGNEDGTVSENEAAFYEARARGGAGLLIVGTACVAYPRGANHVRMPAVSDNRYLPGMTELAARVHRHGAKLAAQLNFMGVYAFVDMEAGRRRLVPYPMPRPRPDRLSMMMTDEELADSAAPFLAPTADLAFAVAEEDDFAWLVDRYAEAAERCRRAGYDGVEVHAGHGYFIDELLSPRNPRTDRWGGPVENRARLLVEVIRAIRARAGTDFPVWMRINAVEHHHEVGEAFEDQCRVIDLAVAAGIDAVHLTAYGNTDVAVSPTDSYAPHVVGALGAQAGEVRGRVDVPVITFGRYEPDEAEQVLADGKADFVAFGRKLLADPDLPAKLADGRVDDVRPCIYQYRCIGNIALRRPARCVVNPRTGREHDLRLGRATTARKVLVVGGGPAGLEAARLLAERGHEVVLREAATRLGGVLVDAAVADPLLDPYLGWLRHGVEQAGVTIELGARVTVDDVPADVHDVVVATGGDWGVPAVAGDGTLASLADLRPWFHDEHRHGVAPDGLVGEEVVILGDGKAALSVAGLCARRGRHVTVVGGRRWFAATLGLPGRARWVADLEAAGVVLLAETVVEQVDEGAVLVRDAHGMRSLRADTIVGIDPSTRVDPLADALAANGRRVLTIGDASALALLEGATETALRAALAVD